MRITLAFGVAFVGSAVGVFTLVALGGGVLGLAELPVAARRAAAAVSFDEALHRGEDFLNAGADILFIEAPKTEQEMMTICQQFDGAKLVANMVEGGKTPYLKADVLQEMCFSIALYPISSLLVVTRTLRDTYQTMTSERMLPSDANRIAFDEYNAIVDLNKLVPDAVD